MISRRRFARSVLATAPLLLIAPRTVFASNKRCTPTEINELGPYHREGTPWRTALAAPTERGRVLKVAGRILAEDRCEPLSDVLIDVWHADGKGHYDFQDDPQPSSPAGYRLRGLMLSNPAGRYQYTTVMPGHYEDRTSHIHYLVQRTGYEPLITQMYFEGDSRNATDPLVRRTLIVPVQSRADGGADVKFDVVLRREQPLDTATLRSFDQYLGTYHDAARDETITIEWRNGRLGATFRKYHANLRPRSASHFLAEEWATYLTFVRDEEGGVAELLADFDDGERKRLKRVR